MNTQRAMFWLQSAARKAQRASVRVQAMVARAIRALLALLAEMRALASEIGWAEYGGRIIRDSDTGEVSGRTPWVPRSDFWPSRPDASLTESQAFAAIGKIERGETLKPIEHRFARYIYGTIIERQLTE